jgi:hypothetical protein
MRYAFISRWCNTVDVAQRDTGHLGPAHSFAFPTQDRNLLERNAELQKLHFTDVT